MFKFACIGCPMNAVDPAKRVEIQHRIDWLAAQVAEARAFGQVVEVARFEQQLRDCHTQLHEMDLIEQYRKDEQRGTFIARHAHRPLRRRRFAWSQRTRRAG